MNLFGQSLIYAWYLSSSHDRGETRYEVNCTASIERLYVYQAMRAVSGLGWICSRNRHPEEWPHHYNASWGLLQNRTWSAAEEAKNRDNSIVRNCDKVRSLKQCLVPLRTRIQLVVYWGRQGRRPGGVHRIAIQYIFGRIGRVRSTSQLLKMLRSQWSYGIQFFIVWRVHSSGSMIRWYILLNRKSSWWKISRRRLPRMSCRTF